MQQKAIYKQMRITPAGVTLQNHFIYLKGFLAIIIHFDFVRTLTLMVEQLKALAQDRGGPSTANIEQLHEHRNASPSFDSIHLTLSTKHFLTSGRRSLGNGWKATVGQAHSVMPRIHPKRTFSTIRFNIKEFVIDLNWEKKAN